MSPSPDQARSVSTQTESDVPVRAGFARAGGTRDAATQADIRYRPATRDAATQTDPSDTTRNASTQTDGSDSRTTRDASSQTNAQADPQSIVAMAARLRSSGATDGSSPLAANTGGSPRVAHRATQTDASPQQPIVQAPAAKKRAAR